MNNIIFKTALLRGETGGISSIAKTSTSGLVDTYTITYTDGTTSTFQVNNGNGISNIVKTATAGEVDTYTINYTNGTTSTFTVTNANTVGLDEQLADIFNIYGAKNLLEYPYYSGGNYTTNGITFTDNGDGTITANGTATASAYFFCRYNTDKKLILEAGETYTVTGCPSGGGSSTYRMYIYSSVSGAFTGNNDIGSGFNTTINIADTPLDFVIQVYSGATVEDVTFSPMIRCASIDDATYIPYVQTNKQLTNNLNEAIGDLTNVYGAKNLLPYPFYYISQGAYTSNGLTYTPNSDGSMTLSGTPTGVSRYNFTYTQNTIESFWSGLDWFKEGAKIEMSLGGAVYSEMAIYLEMAFYNTNTESWEVFRSNNGIESVTITLPSDFSNYSTVTFYIYQNYSSSTTPYTYEDVTVYPMLRCASIQDDTYQPYVLTNKQLTERARTLLWTNSSFGRNVGFEELEVTIDISDYSYIDVEYCLDVTWSSTNSSAPLSFKRFAVPTDFTSNYLVDGYSNGICTRAVNIMPDEVYFATARYYLFGGSGSSTTTTLLVPYKIYGVKTI